MDATKYQLAEYRLSIYGRKAAEWDTLAAWVCNNQLYSENVVWMIQLPRLYNVYKEQGILRSFQDMLDNVSACKFGQGPPGWGFSFARVSPAHPGLHSPFFFATLSSRSSCLSSR